MIWETGKLSNATLWGGGSNRVAPGCFLEQFAMFREVGGGATPEKGSKVDPSSFECSPERGTRRPEEKRVH